MIKANVARVCSDLEVEILDPPGDGHCFFTALGWLLGLSMLEVRDRMADQWSIDWYQLYLKAFIVADNRAHAVDGVSWVTRNVNWGMRVWEKRLRTGRFNTSQVVEADEILILLAAHTFNVHIVVHSPTTPSSRIAASPPHVKDDTRYAVFVLARAIWDTAHYMVVTAQGADPRTLEPSHPLVLGLLRGRILTN